MNYHLCLNRNGYILKKDQIDESILKKLKKDLTASPIVLQGYQEFIKPVSFEIFQESPGYFYLPRFYGIETFGSPRKTYLPEGAPINLTFAFNLLPHQIIPYQKTIQTLKTVGGGVLQLPCGLGKTALTIKVATDLGRKTLVLVNKEFLMDQWVESLHKFTGGIARVGILQQGKMDVENKDFIVAMLHSVAKKDYPKEVFTDIGFCVVDECFPDNTLVVTEQGYMSIDTLYGLWRDGFKIPRIKSYNLSTHHFEYCQLTYAWEKTTHQLIQLTLSSHIGSIFCTPNHLFLTTDGYKEAIRLTPSDHIITDTNITRQIVSRKILSDSSNLYQITVYDLEISDHHNYLVTDENGTEGVVVHNCHHIASEMFSKALPKVASRYMLGLSATPKRKDGLSHVFHKYLGPLHHSERRTGSNRVLVKRFRLSSPSPLYETIYMSNGIKNSVAMITNLSKCEVRTALIVETVRILMREERKILLLSGRLDQLSQIHNLLGVSKITTVGGRPITWGYYFGNHGNNKKIHRQMLQESAKCDVILGTTAVACLSDQTIYINPLTGEETTLATLATQSPTHLPVISLNETTRQFELDQTDGIAYTQSKPCYRVIHQLGEMVVSYDHQLYTQRGWVETQYLTLSDYLGTDHQIQITPMDIPEISWEDCWRIGSIIGSSIQPEPIQETLMLLPNGKITGLLKGLFEQLGVVVGYRTTSNRLRNQIIILLKRLGISSIQTDTCLQIPPHEVPRFYRILSDTKLLDDDRFTNSLDWVGIRQIQPIVRSDQIKLCDLTVHKNHNLMIGGILVHNSEGLDIPDLNTEIMATPMTDVEQSVGRILRKFHNKLNPIVVDLVDSCGNFTKQASVRAKFYREEDYEIQDLRIPLGLEIRDLQTFLPEITQYLTHTDFMNKQMNLTDGNDDDDDDEEKPSVEIMKGHCLLDEVEPVRVQSSPIPVKPKSKPRLPCLLDESVPTSTPVTSVTTAKPIKLVLKCKK